MIRLFVNIDHVATVREARKTFEPDPLQAALLAQKAGAYGITAHLREDRRHVQDDDIRRLKERINIPLNLEMAPVDEMINIAIMTKPLQVSIVPEKRKEITTEGGLNVLVQEKHLASVAQQIKQKDILYSLFIDPEPEQLEAAKRVGADSIELNTGPYSNSKNHNDAKIHLAGLRKAANLAHNIGLRVFAGHGLTNHNVKDIAAMPEVEELNIGHHIISRSIFVGMEQSVNEILNSIKNGLNMRS